MKKLKCISVYAGPDPLFKAGELYAASSNLSNKNLLLTNGKTTFKAVHLGHGRYRVKDTNWGKCIACRRPEIYCSSYVFQVAYDYSITFDGRRVCNDPRATNPMYMVQKWSGSFWYDTGMMSNSLTYLTKVANEHIEKDSAWLDKPGDRMIRIVSARPNLEKKIGCDPAFGPSRSVVYYHSVLIETESATHNAIQALKKKPVTAPNHNGFTLWCPVGITKSWGFFGIRARVARIGLVSRESVKILLAEHVAKQSRRHD